MIRVSSLEEKSMENKTDAPIVMVVTDEDVQEAKQSLDPRVVELLARVVNHLLSERPPKPYESLEQIVSSLKNKDEDNIDPYDAGGAEYASLIQNLARSEDESVRKLHEEWVNRAPQAAPWTDCREQLCLLQRYAGVGLHQEDADFLLALVMRRLEQNFPAIYRLRFWGCIAFRWYVLEAELTPQGYTARAGEIKAAAMAAQEEAKIAWEAKKKEALETGAEPPAPFQLPEPGVPSEPPGTGVNSQVYLVSVDPVRLESWTWLPDLTPTDINAARQVAHIPMELDDQIDFCSLSAAQFMRAQIARINSATRVAPLGLFRMRRKLAPGEVDDEDEDDDEEDEDDEDDEEPKEARFNARFKQPTLQVLLDQNNWVHTTANILQQQARTKWWNPNPDADDDEDDEEEGVDRPGPEKGPKPMSPISQDEAYPELVPGFPTCWALRTASVLGPPAVVARSLTWPGSISVFAAGRLEHVYIGLGMKASSHHFCPKLMDGIMPEPEELVLAKDPTLEEEKAAAHNSENEEDEEEEEDDD